VSSGTYRITLFEPPGDTPFAKLLAGSGIEVDLVTDPRQLLARIDASPPNLVVIEMSARGARAQDFLALVRGHGRWSDLPVALVASDVPSEMEALRADADAVLRRDADPALVRARLRAVLDRLRRERQLRSTDTHLGVLTRTAFLRAADREIAVARRTRQPLTVARVDSDPRNRAPSDVALRPLAAALSTGIRWTDTVGLVGESGLGVLMPSCTADQARSRLTPLLARAAAPETPCIGLADTTAVVEDVLVRADRELLAVRKR
jgi:PleD family two-component response regulator